uniref:Uncharacterized protein n=1 Tax=Oryza sativa subsp. japonica TaxID=39947 RepID=Q8S6A6_ORYSJ|nr:hypothetical protein [Oryza sativa Japonica Group]
MAARRSTLALARLVAEGAGSALVDRLGVGHNLPNTGGLVLKRPWIVLPSRLTWACTAVSAVGAAADYDGAAWGTSSWLVKRISALVWSALAAAAAFAIPAMFGTCTEVAGAEGGSDGAGAEADGAPPSSATGAEVSAPSSVAISALTSLSFRLVTFSFTTFFGGIRSQWFRLEVPTIDASCCRNDNRIRRKTWSLNSGWERSCHVLINLSRNKNHSLKGIIELIKNRKEIDKH